MCRHQHSKHKDRRSKYKQYPTHPHANKNNRISIQEDNLREKTHTFAYVNKNWQKGHENKKNKKTHTHIYIYIYTFSASLVLILIPILTSPKPKTLIFYYFMYSIFNKFPNTRNHIKTTHTTHSRCVNTGQCRESSRNRNR
jgi:hypothetical protein